MTIAGECEKHGMYYPAFPGCPECRQAADAPTPETHLEALEQRAERLAVKFGTDYHIGYQNGVKAAIATIRKEPK